MSTAGPRSKRNPSCSSVASLPPTHGLRSSTTTSWPAPARRIAAARPPSPAPITTTLISWPASPPHHAGGPARTPRPAERRACPTTARTARRRPAPWTHRRRRGRGPEDRCCSGGTARTGDRVAERERRAALEPARLPVERVDRSLDHRIDRIAELTDPTSKVVGEPIAVSPPIDPAVEVRHRFERVDGRATRTARRGVADRLHRHEDRWIGHPDPALDDRFERLVPLVAEMEVLSRRPFGASPRTPATQSRHDGENRPRLATRGASTPPSRVL